MLQTPTIWCLPAVLYRESGSCYAAAQLTQHSISCDGAGCAAVGLWCQLLCGADPRCRRPRTSVLGAALDSGSGDPAADVVLPVDGGAAAPAASNGAAAAGGQESPVLPIVPFDACLSKFFAAEVNKQHTAVPAWPCARCSAAACESICWP